MIELDRDGVYTLTDDADPTRVQVIPAGAPEDDVKAAIAAFFPPDLSMPDTVPMHQVLMFLQATNRLAQVSNFLTSLPEPSRSLALIEWQRAPNFVPLSALGMAAKTALGLSDDDYALAVRDMATYTIDDYGSPKPSLLAQIARFLWGG